MGLESPIAWSGAVLQVASHGLSTADRQRGQAAWLFSGSGLDLRFMGFPNEGSETKGSVIMIEAPVVADFDFEPCVHSKPRLKL